MDDRRIASRSRTFSAKPDFDECMERVEAWYEQKIVDRPPVRFHHHNIEYEKRRTIKGPWATAEERWLDVDFQVGAFIDSIEASEFPGETFVVAARGHVHQPAGAGELLRVRFHV